MVKLRGKTVFTELAFNFGGHEREFIKLNLRAKGPLLCMNF